MIEKVAVTIDPGLGGTGYAFWNWKTFQRNVRNRNGSDIQNQYATPMLTDSGTIKAGGGSWEYRCGSIILRLQTLIRNPDLSIKYVLVEGQAYFESGKGQASAKTGSLIKLVHMAGAIHGMCTANIIAHKIVPVTWKGQLNDRKVASRVRAVIKRPFNTSHEVDAVGIGLFLQGAAFQT